MTAFALLFCSIAAAGVSYGAWRNLQTAQALREIIRDFRITVDKLESVSAARLHRFEHPFVEVRDPERVARQLKKAVRERG